MRKLVLVIRILWQTWKRGDEASSTFLNTIDDFEVSGIIANNGPTKVDLRSAHQRPPAPTSAIESCLTFVAERCRALPGAATSDHAPF
jgi:hypothetical protein